MTYRGFTDPSGGSGGDSFTLAIAHAEVRGGARVAVLDVVREQRPPFSPEATVAEFARVLRAYRVTTVAGDRYAGEWPGEQFRKHGVAYEPSERTKSELYAELLPLLNSGRVELLDHPRLLAQLASLERRTARGGRDSIDHAPGGHDDLANAAAGALVLSVANACPHCDEPECDGVTPPLAFVGSPEYERWCEVHPDPDAPRDVEVEVPTRDSILDAVDKWVSLDEAGDAEGAAALFSDISVDVALLEAQDPAAGDGLSDLLQVMTEEDEEATSA